MNQAALQDNIEFLYPRNYRGDNPVKKKEESSKLSPSFSKIDHAKSEAEFARMLERAFEGKTYKTFTNYDDAENFAQEHGLRVVRLMKGVYKGSNPRNKKNLHLITRNHVNKASEVVEEESWFKRVPSGEYMVSLV